jgi:hypothetical protein
MGSAALAETYYVSNTNGLDSNTGLKGKPWKTLDKANASLKAGDTVVLIAGDYIGEYINPVNSGSSGSPITYKKVDGSTVTIKDAAYGVRINGKSYIRVEGLSFYNLDHHLYISNGNYNEIKYCTFDDMRNYTWHGSRIYKNSQFNHIHHNTFKRWGEGHSGALLDIGDEWTDTDNSYYNLIEDNQFHYGGHHVLGIYSRYCVIRNNYLQNDEWERGGYRAMITEGMAAEKNLIEKNIIAYAYDEGVGLTLSSKSNIVRFNKFYYNDRSGIEISMEGGMIPANNNRIYNNTFYSNGYAEDQYYKFLCGILVTEWNGDGEPTGNVIKNNIFYKNKNSLSIGYYSVSDKQIVVNNWEENGDPLFIDRTTEGPIADAKKLESGVDFLSISENSPVRDKGTWLTTITSPDGSGSLFQVNDASYFMDGWSIIEGDTIRLQGQDDNFTIKKVDYAKNTIEIKISEDQKVPTWEKGLGVSLNYQGYYPDMGSNEYGLADSEKNTNTEIAIIAPSKLRVVLIDK